MIVGQRVIVFTESGMFPKTVRSEGIVTEVKRGGAFVHVSDERLPMYFTWSEITPASEHQHLGGAE